MCNFDMYTGASSNTSVRDDGGLGPSIVKNLIESYKEKGYLVFCDNLFSTVDLAMGFLPMNTFS